MPPSERHTPIKLSLKDVAVAAGVSVSTVSLALRNRPGIAVNRREHIKQIAAKLGYRPDPTISRLMTHLRQERPQRPLARMALVMPGFPHNRDVKLDLMVKGAKRRAEDYGFGLEEFWPKDPPVLSLSRLRTILRTRGIDGLLIGPMQRGDDELDFDFSDFSVVALGYSMARPEVHRAVPHHYRMMREMLQELLDRGFRRIGLVLWERMETGFNHLLSAAFFQMQHRLPARDRLDILHVELPPDEIPSHQISAWLKKTEPEVILAPGLIYGTLRKLGYDVPRDLSFINLDLGDPPHDAAGLIAGYESVGSAAVDLLVSQLNLNQRGVPYEAKTVMVRSSWRSGPTLGSPRQTAKSKSLLRPI